MVTVHVPVPVQSPDQPVKVEPDAGAAVSGTEPPEGYEAEQTVPQLTPDGAELTEPAPVPFLLTVSTWFEPLYAAAAATRPQPKFVFGTVLLPPQPEPPFPTAGFADPVSTCFVAAMFRTRSGRADQSSATTPDTCGPAIDVPLNNE